MWVSLRKSFELNVLLKFGVGNDGVKFGVKFGVGDEKVKFGVGNERVILYTKMIIFGT